MIRAFILLFLCLSFINTYGQFSDNFNDGNLNSDPTWQGDTNNFTINNELELQLSASEGGNSVIFLETTYPDSVEWEIFFTMDFSPSTSNQLKIYLLSDNTDLSQANSYFLEIGESGSDDAFQFYRSDNGTNVFLGSGTLGALGGSKATADLRISLNEDGLWSFYADYENNGCKLLDFEVFDNTYGPETGQFFLLSCSYTSTRIDKFFFDDIEMRELTPDTEGPLVSRFEVVNATTILVYFNEFVDESSISNLENFVVDSGIGNPVSAEIVNGKAVQLVFSTPFQSGQSYLLSLSNIEDLFGNTIAANTTLEFFLTETPQVGELLINEILFNPYPDKFDFIEIYNSSSKFLNLEGLIIQNTQRNEDFVEIDNNLILFPGEYLALTPNKQSLAELYTFEFPEKVISQDLPSFNNDEGNVSLFVKEGGSKITLDSFNYNENYHYRLLFDVEGVSLERISFMGGSDDPENWHSAAEAAGYATPGYKNSQFVEGISGFEDPFQFTTKVFSPNNDGNNDLLIINYELEQPGYVSNIKIFDVKGRFIKNLTRNLLLGTEGFVKWDGTNADSELASLGIYIVLLELIHPSGDIKHFKKTCVLADFLN
jgi:hypothetical protein